MRLEITCHDRVGMGQKVLGIFVEHGINVRGIELKQPGRIFINIPDLEFADLQTFMPQLRLLEGVGDVRTAPFMPSERERNELVTLIKTFPDPFISIDAKGNIRIVNNIAATIMGSDEFSIKGQHVSQWLKGFNFTRWLESDDVLAQTRRLKFLGEDFVADIMPINVAGESNISGENNKQILAGAVLILKSEARLGQQINAFKQPNENSFAGIQAGSSAMRKVIREAKRMSQLDSSILIIGETGTGKELLARACHAASERAELPFMTLNCAALPDDVAESELFGVGEKEQEASKRGIFELADGGSVFLDEVGEMSTKLQSKLLRVIQNGSFRRVNSEQEITVNVRIISSTNKDLLNLVSMGEFREDLYYRLNVFGLNIPSLRERRSDILPLTEYFITHAGQRIGRSHLKLTPECRDFIEHYPWPGNVRQLENVLTRAASLLEGDEIDVEHLQLPAYTREHGYLEQEFEGTLDAAVKSFEADLLRKLYPAYPSTRQLAKKLGLSHTAIANKLREYDINKKTVKI
ncbi:MAG: transcriptional regulator TyrR [Colwellia sp.]|nr:transcriptional regulator TyrR [Colwellia sp.]MCW9082967.1 transcriptional regulator TyrR [Colwellia sp.]